MEGVEPAVVKEPVLLQQSDGEVDGFLGVLLDLDTELDGRTFFAAELEEVFKRGDADGLTQKFLFTPID